MNVIAVILFGVFVQPFCVSEFVCKVSKPCTNVPVWTKLVIVDIV
jgi:hypothetical protein